MKIGQFCTYDAGGAGKAAARLNSALNSIGENSIMHVKYKQSYDDTIIQINSNEINNVMFEDLGNKYFRDNIKPGKTMASIMYPSIGFNYLNCIKDLDIVNLHWISGLISLEAIMKIHNMKKPMVWTLHDENPFTGACHYTGGCEKYKTDCSECPQLLSDEFNITKKILKLKSENIPKDIVIVTPSLWLAETAKESRVFKNNRIEVIPNSLDMEIYSPVNKDVAKAKLGINPQTKVILFGADNIAEERKGFALLLETMIHLKKEKYIQDLLGDDKFLILNFGSNNENLNEMNLPYRSLGYITDERELSLIYSASDVVVLPSLEDNLPNIMIEAMACGTPVVGFEVGGLKDAVVENITGYLCELKDTRALALNVMKVLKNKSMSEKCVDFSRKKYLQDIQARAYRELYIDILNNNVSSKHYFHDVPYMFPDIQKDIINYISSSYMSQKEEILKLDNLHREYLYRNNELQDKNDNLTNVVNDKNEELRVLYIKNEETNENLKNLSIEHEETNEKLKKLSIVYEETNQELRLLHIEHKQLIDMRLQLENDLAILRDDNIRLYKDFDNIYASKSWKITKPLRFCLKIMKKIKSKIVK
jgi:Glycosyltransferase